MPLFFFVYPIFAVRVSTPLDKCGSTVTKFVPEGNLASSDEERIAADTTVSPREVEKIAERALVLQSYLLRRAWGALYATLSLAMFVTIFVSPVVGYLGLSSESTLVLHLAVNLAASAIASPRFFDSSRVHDTAEIRDAIVDKRRSKPLGYRVLSPTWVAIYAILILTVAFFRPQAVWVILAVYLFVAAYMLYSLRLSFPLKLPAEGIVVVAPGHRGWGSLALLPFFAGDSALMSYSGGRR